MSIYVCKYPFFFWIMQKYEVDGSEECVVYQGKNFTLKPFAKIYFLLLKYLIPFLFIGIILNKYDFAMNFNKAIEVIVGLCLCLFYKYFIAEFIIVACLMLYCFIVMDTTIISYSLKYALIFLILNTAFRDCRDYNVFVISSNQKTSHCLIRKRREML